MKKMQVSGLIFAALFITACSTTETKYSRGYDNDYVYSVGYYGYQPFWGRSNFSGDVSGNENLQDAYRWYERRW